MREAEARSFGKGANDPTVARPTTSSGIPINEPHNPWEVRNVEATNNADYSDTKNSEVDLADKTYKEMEDFDKKRKYEKGYNQMQ